MLALITLLCFSFQWGDSTKTFQPATIFVNSAIKFQIPGNIIVNGSEIIRYRHCEILLTTPDSSRYTCMHCSPGYHLVLTSENGWKHHKCVQNWIPKILKIAYTVILFIFPLYMIFWTIYRLNVYGRLP